MDLDLLSELAKDKKGFFYLTVFIYVTGFLSTTLYYAKFGLSNTVFLNSYYFLSGTLTLIPLVIVIIIEGLISNIPLSKYTHFKRLGIVLRALLFIISIPLLGLIMLVLSYAFPSLTQLTDFKSFDFVGMFGLVIIWVILKVGQFILPYISRFSNEEKFTSNYLRYPLLFFFGYIIYIGECEYFYYDKIPSNMGGGKLENIQFLLKDKQKFVGILQFKDSLTSPYPLVQSDDKTITILLDSKSNKIVQLDKAEIYSITYFYAKK